jgi:hypothetical protein
MIVKNNNRGQSLVELSLIFPILLLLVAGIVEIGFYAYNYLTLLELTREAARFASIRDIFAAEYDSSDLPQSACDDGSKLHYFYDTACILVDETLGFNPYLFLDPAIDDVVISVFTIDSGVVSHRWPASGGIWSLYSDNWQKDCDGNVINTVPFFTNTEIENMLDSQAPVEEGFVVVEAYYCHWQVLNLPMVNQLANPIRLHAYSVISASEAVPTLVP